ncbi:protein EFFECTOR OF TRANSCRIPTION 2 [Cornus florida]|uniref:protein EFFECTOR OF TRANSCRIPTION 2 n=1 Tax=Cornus florida TaxID=4283 RepID=UPI00289FDD31|nr:protein EFFECTOR OF TRANSCRIPTION 2 [Cornus florida]
MATVVVSTRLKREKYKRTKHDSAFSDWKILIGPSDWEDHKLGKEGAARYRVHNLPNCASCPGIYELGIAVSHSRSGRTISKLDQNRIITVYVGQAENVRTRLQCYGQAGAHLENGSSTGELRDSVRKGPGLFTEIFSRGFPIVYRWAPMNNKRDAEKTETQLLDKFDYAWNKGSNGARRHDDILQKLNRSSLGTIQLPAITRKLQTFFQKQVGVRIKACEPLVLENGSTIYTNSENNDLFPQIFKFGRSHPKLVSMRFHVNDDHANICGVALGHGSVCGRPPVEGRKRCAEHKGMKINGSMSKLITEVKQHYVRGPVLESSTCPNENEQVSPETHKTGTRRPDVFLEKSVANKEYGTICGVDLENGTFCTRQPVAGRKRCEEHKGMRVKDSMPKSSATGISSVYDGSGISAYNDQKYDNISPGSVSSRNALNGDSSTCGAPLANGSFCKRQPVEDRKRCWQHKGMKVNGSSKEVEDKIGMYATSSGISASNDCKYNNASPQSVSCRTATCGATLVNGSFCRRQPAEGAKRCWQHKGMKVNSSASNSFISTYDTQEFLSHICGAALQNGSVCRRMPVHGRKRCQQHKGMRAAPSYYF